MIHEFKHNALAIIAGTLAALLAPAEPIMPSAWAAKNLIVPDGPYAGQPFKLELTPYLAEPLDFFSSDCPDNKQVVRKSKQTGFTTLAIGACGYIADVEPADVFLIEPTDSSLSDFVNLKLQPAIDNSPALARKVSPQMTRSGKGSTTYLKRYPGGSLLMGIATSTADLRGKTRKIVIRDEASEYPDDLGGQGSPHDMISGSYESFLATGDYKDAAISTPVVKGACYIDAEFDKGDQRYWHVRCPGCGEKFVFTFDLSRFKFNERYPYEAHYVAPCCGSVIEGHQKNALVREGEWIATAPAPGKHRSYHFDALSSPFVPWDVIAQRYNESKDDPARLKTFHNLTLGLAYEIKGDAPDHARLMALREDYARRRIPPRGLLLTASADVQANGIYVEVVAFTQNRESWSIEALFLDGDTTDPDAGAFAKLSQVYETVWPDSFGGGRRVDAFGVDSGFRSHVVYAWTRARDGCFALKGGDGWQRPPIGTPTPVDIDLGGKKIKQGAAVWTVGTWSIKAQLYADLRKRRLAEGAEVEPAGACHHGTWMDEAYFVQLTNEYLAERTFRGRTRREWTERGPNHWLDCRVYNVALADYLGLTRLTADEWARLGQLRGVPKEWRAPDLLAPESVKLAAVDPADGLPERPRQAAPIVRETPSPPRGRRSTVSSFM
jgi:phage terminase large subunit GpA-like protein